MFSRLRIIGTLTRGSGIKRTDIIQDGFPCVRYGELYTTYKTSFIDVRSNTSKEIFDKSHKINHGDILITLTGENKEDISKALAYMGTEPVALGGDLTRLTVLNVNPIYIVYALNSPYSTSIKKRLATGDIIVHFSNDKLNAILLPLPPIEEQNRIIKSIDIVFRLLDSLV